MTTPRTRRLLLLRHAKSDWHADNGPDHDRPLNDRGRRDAPRIGRFLAAACMPDHVITSSALRAQDTVRRAAAAGGWRAEVEVEPGLYGGDPKAVLRRARSAPDAAHTLLLAGHQPTWSGLVTALTGARGHMPTAAVACVELALAHWRDLESGIGCLRWLVTPKLLGSIGVGPDRDRIP